MNCVVIGQGRAGRVRARTIQEHPACTLTRHVAGRDFDIPQSQEKHLYFVCTENQKHFSTSMKLLEQGHDVVVEFPPCSTQKEWMQLSSLAQSNSCILHCGLIGLYTKEHKARREWLTHHTAQKIHVSFSGGLYRWVRLEAEKGNIPQLSFGRIAALWDLCGPLSICDVQLIQEPTQYTWTLLAKGSGDVDVLLREHREESGKRSADWIMKGAGVEYTPPKRLREDLFAVDLERILHRIPCDVSILEVYGFLDKVHAILHEKNK